jgi:hypothetical protein
MTALDKGAAIAALDRIASLAEDTFGVTDETRWAVREDYETVMACLAAPQSVVDALIPPQDTTLFERPGGA